MNIGETIRNFRLGKGMSQGDIEKRTGLLRCYLSRVENGHTIPSLDTLAKIAGPMELPLSKFFSESAYNRSKGLPRLSDDELRFLSQIRRYSVSLNDSDRKLVLAMVKKWLRIRGRDKLSALMPSAPTLKPYFGTQRAKGVVGCESPLIS